MCRGIVWSGGCRMLFQDGIRFSWSSQNPGEYRMCIPTVKIWKMYHISLILTRAHVFLVLSGISLASARENFQRAFVFIKFLGCGEVWNLSRAIQKTETMRALKKYIIHARLQLLHDSYPMTYDYCLIIILIVYIRAHTMTPNV